MTTDPLNIGDIQLLGTECSEPLLLGQERKLIRFDFAGGKRIIQDFGDFPVEAIVIKGVMFGEFAEVRSNTLEQLAKSALEIPLTWGRQKYRGVVKHYRPTIHHRNQIAFEIEYWPTVNDSTHQGNADLTDPDSQVVWAAEHLDRWMILYNKIPSQVELPENVNKKWTLIKQNLSTFHKNNQGAGKQLSRDVQLQMGSALNDIIKLLTPIRLSGTTQQSRIAGEGISLAQVMRNAIVEPKPRVLKIPVSNPNLIQLAAQYYGDATLWTIIADANNLGNETNPIGEFLLKIPFDVKTSVKT